MNKLLNRKDITDLTVAERLQLIDDIWHTLIETPDGIDVPDWHRRELDERIAARESSPQAARPWSDVKSEILDALRCS